MCSDFPRSRKPSATAKTVTACVFEQSHPSQGARKTTIVWDALVQGNIPIEPGQTVLHPLIPIIGNALPNKVEVIAGIWADGESFGPPKWASNIFNYRALRAAEDEDAAAILQRGLDQNWNRNQYLQAFSDKPDSGPVYIVRTALTATQQTGQTPQEFTIPCNSCCSLSNNKLTNSVNRFHRLAPHSRFSYYPRAPVTATDEVSGMHLLLRMDRYSWRISVRMLA
jgi:hypothetical protein